MPSSRRTNFEHGKVRNHATERGGGWRRRLCIIPVDSSECRLLVCCALQQDTAVVSRCQCDPSSLFSGASQDNVLKTCKNLFGQNEEVLMWHIGDISHVFDVSEY